MDCKPAAKKGGRVGSQPPWMRFRKGSTQSLRSQGSEESPFSPLDEQKERILVFGLGDGLLGLTRRVYRLAIDPQDDVSLMNARQVRGAPGLHVGYQDPSVGLRGGPAGHPGGQILEPKPPFPLRGLSRPFRLYFARAQLFN